jgi:hypothetical protein
MPNYQILIDATPYDPTNFGDIGIDFEPNTENGGYFFRKRLGGDLSFYRAAYSYILAQIGISQCTELVVEIQQLCAGAWVTILEGYFTRQDCKINYDDCTIECEITTVDEYTCLLKNADKDINFLAADVGVLPPEDFAYIPSFGLELLLVETVGLTCGSEPLFGQPFFGIGAITGNIGINYCLYARYVIRVNCLGGILQPPAPAFSTWFLLSDECAINGTATYYRNVQLTEITLTVNFTNCIGIACVPPICSTANTRDMGVFLGTPPFLNQSERVCVEISSTNFFFWNTRPLVGTLDYILDQICGTGLVVDSELLTNATNPVTAVNPNPMATLSLQQKSDSVNPTATERATIANLSFKDAMSDLTTLLNALWYVDKVTNKLVFEHVTGILSLVIGTDLTTLDGGKWNVGRNVISYDKEQIPREETFTYAKAAQYQDFLGLPIVYTQGCTKSRSLEVRTQVMETEVVRIFQNPNEQNEGLILLATNSLNEDETADEVGELSQLFIPNAPLAWANLHRDYYRDYRYLSEGTLNGVNTVFNSTRPIKRQENLTFPIACLNDFNPLELIKTSQGSGRVLNAKYDLSSQFITVTIKFEDL